MPDPRLPLVLAVALLDGCSDTTPISVENRAGVEIHSVVVSGKGFERNIGDLAPGATTKVQVQPTGESGLGITFRANDKVISLPLGGYFEGGGRYVVSVVVTPDLKASVNSDLRAY